MLITVPIIVYTICVQFLVVCVSPLALFIAQKQIPIHSHEMDQIDLSSSSREKKKRISVFEEVFEWKLGVSLSP